jgi:hypothetical protein
MYNPMNTEAPHDDEKMDLGFFVSLMVTSIAVCSILDSRCSTKSMDEVCVPCRFLMVSMMWREHQEDSYGWTTYRHIPRVGNERGMRN